MGILYIVATPIGNLEDITFRAVRILMESDYILAEDTRSAKKLLEHFHIQKPIISYWAHNHFRRVDEVIQLLKARKALVLISDAGTPAISDPGALLVSEVAKQIGVLAKIVPIPGPSAVVSALSVAGFPSQSFYFAGFPPAKNKRQKFFKEALSFSEPVVFYESPHRILKTLDDIVSCLGVKNANRPAVVLRELTKQFETIYRGTVTEIISELKQNNQVRGEFVVVIGQKVK